MMALGIAMRTIGDLVDSRSSDGENNFLILRLVAAALVIYGHSFYISNTGNPAEDFTARYLGYTYSGEVGLEIFFVVSGFLVVGSFCKRNNPAQFIESRLLRIVPAFVICLLLMVLMGAALGSLPLSGYFQSSATWHYFLSNVLFREAVYSLPGVVLTANPTYGQSMNGAIWSLFVEVRLYVLVGLAGTFGVLRNRLRASFVMAGLLAVGILAPAYLSLIGTDPTSLRVSMFFLIGAFLYANRDLIPLNGWILLLLFLACILSRHTVNFNIAVIMMIAYGTIFLAYTRKVHIPCVEDYSYGIYIYGWPAAQLIVRYWPTIGAVPLAAATLCCAWVLGFLSWHLIEKRALKLKGKFGRGTAQPRYVNNHIFEDVPKGALQNVKGDQLSS
ncbi:acyltransferase family protein [Rhizobium lusitanum]|uniref:Acyltransferase family protein n=1 Tax=Rhizobium lusitanum TaxID=293958 RepID=A0A6L9U7L5_9HYPH|nr:acyltransferase [Rhizobium lusitanum]NEI70130.1 acyltransferase family protein [Rhizobium lusitanum]